jgi:serine/threonine-protein kinase
MALEAGTRLGVYEIRSALGAGGMGEVYRARDTRLQRDVALKILPDAFASDPERLARFEREAQVLASLNHPNIAAIHGLEEGPVEAGHHVRALVLELVEGDTLADEIGRRAGPSRPAGLPLEEAVPIARQIADALEAAHEQGIVHRDLKPANIKVRPDGTVKVLDFGLAKLVQAPGPGPQASVNALTVSPTITTPAMTQMGVIMGTAAYMSPEQAKGREADKRSDVWAFGAVLYEMLTGRRAFDGEDMSDTLASVLKSDPDWTRLPPDAPPALRTLLQRCLAKDRRQRVSEISTAKFILSELGNISGSQITTARAAYAEPSRALWRRALPVAASVVITALIVGAAAWRSRPVPSPPVIAQFSFAPEGQSFTGTASQVIDISRDGTRLAYVANNRIYVRPISQLDARPVTDAIATAPSPFSVSFSPDGESILFGALSESGPVLKRVPLNGGAASTLATLEGSPSYSGLSSSGDSILLAAAGGNGGILRVGAGGGQLERIVTLEQGEIMHGPQMLPDGKTVLFTVAKNTGVDRWDKAQIVAQSLDGGPRRVLVEGSDGRYMKSGHLLYAVGGTVYAARFDADTLAVGAAVPVVSGVRRATGGQTGATQMAISDTGTLVYVPGPATIVANTRGLVIGDARSDPVQLGVEPAVYVHPRISPDGRVVAVGRNDGQSSDVWTYDTAGKTAIKRLTFGGGSRFPVWSADSRRVTFQSAREGDRGIWWQAADSGTAERLTSAAKDEEHIPEAWSRDGARLLFSVRKGLVYSLWVFTLNGRRTEPFGKVQSEESLSATFSPDGRWVAYAYTERAGGTLSPNRGIFVEPFPPTDEKHQVPKTVLDYHPVWAPDGKSILYVPGSSRPLVSVPITTQPAVAFGKPVALTRAPLPGLISLDVRGYDLLRDGRILSVSVPQGQTGSPPTEIRVVLNWFQELKRLVPQ